MPWAKFLFWLVIFSQWTSSQLARGELSTHHNTLRSRTPALSHVACTLVPLGEQISLPPVIITRAKTGMQISANVLSFEYQVLVEEDTTELHSPLILETCRQWIKLTDALRRKRHFQNLCLMVVWKGFVSPSWQSTLQRTMLLPWLCLNSWYEDDKEGEVFSLSYGRLLRADTCKQVIFVFLKWCKGAHICFDGSVP